MKLRCLTALLIFSFFWKSPEAGVESFAYRGYVKKEAGRLVVLTRPQGDGAICAVWEIENDAMVTINGNDAMKAGFQDLENRPMDIRMTVKAPASSRPADSPGRGTITSMELTLTDSQTAVNPVCSMDANVARLAI